MVGPTREQLDDIPHALNAELYTCRSASDFTPVVETPDGADENRDSRDVHLAGRASACEPDYPHGTRRANGRGSQQGLGLGGCFGRIYSHTGDDIDEHLVHGRL